MISGSEEIRYSAVEAYGVSPLTEPGVISGGMGGDATVNNGVRFLWVYDPNEPNGDPSGFSGQGWFADIEGSPIWYNGQFEYLTLEIILSQFENRSRQNLNDVFQNWQKYIDVQAGFGYDVVNSFVFKVGQNCASFISQS